MRKRWTNSCAASREAEGRKLRHALEVRHESFDHPEFIALMRERGVAIVEAGDAWYPRIAASTAPFRYLRLMGTSAEESKGYPARTLTRWRTYAKKLAATGDVFLYFISGAYGLTHLAAQAFIARLDLSSDATADRGDRRAGNPAS